MGSKLRIGMVGAGGIVLHRHLPALLRMEEVEIVAVSNASYESSRRFCQEHLPRATPMKNWADLVALPDLDVVWIGTPPYMHAPVTISALEAGRHVFCQARMAMNLEEAEEMLEASRKNPELVTALCPPPQGLKGDHLVRELLGEQEIGTPIGFHLRSLAPTFLNPDAPLHWRQRVEISGLNVLALGIYVEVLQRWLGPIRAISAQGTTLHRIRGGEEVRIPDRVDLLVEFVNGVSGSMELSGITAGQPVNDLRIDGSQASFHYNFSNDEITINRSGEDPQAVGIPAAEERHWTVERDFIDAILYPQQPRPRPSFEDGVAYMRVVQAVADSIAEERRIELQPEKVAS
ncbi:MAG TPA: Gfo/Idh/MocA family oxidoreductase [Chthoniobacteraceae bacterium]|nr:Gfo/Idh/MocA family oxidoreductase [Chthoniobacteraceae bacterium]